MPLALTLSQSLGDDLAIELIVIRDENPCVFSNQIVAGRNDGRRHVDESHGRLLERYDDGHLGADVVLGFEVDRSAHELHQLRQSESVGGRVSHCSFKAWQQTTHIAGDAQTETRAAVLTSSRCVCLVERHEEMRNCFLFDADTCVFNFEADTNGMASLALLVQAERDRAFLRELRAWRANPSALNTISTCSLPAYLDGVGQHVGQDLSQSRHVAEDLTAKDGVNFLLERQRFLRRGNREDASVRHDVLEFECAVFKLEFACFDLAHVLRSARDQSAVRANMLSAVAAALTSTMPTISSKISPDRIIF